MAFLDFEIFQALPSRFKNPFGRGLEPKSAICELRRPLLN
jgi:hypothetical protein